MDLEARLERTLEENPDSFSDSSVDHVRQLISHVEGNRNGNQKYSYLTELGDWQLYHRMHPEWQGKAPSELKGEGHSFYNRFTVWTRESSLPKKERRRMMFALFKSKQADFSSLVTIDDWIRAKCDNPEWRDASSREMQRNYVEGGNRFYMHCKNYLYELTQDPDERIALMHKVFNVKCQVRAYKRIGEWRDEYRRRFKSLSIRQMEDNTMPGAQAYINALRKWLVRHSFDAEGRKSAMKSIFRRYGKHMNVRKARKDREDNG